MWWKIWKPVRSGLHGWRLAPRKCGATCTTSATSREGRVAYFGFDEVQVEVLKNSKFAQNLPRSPCQLPCDNMVLAHLQHFTWRITGENRREGEDDDEAYRHGKSLFDLKNCSGNNRFITHKNAYAVFEKTAMERSKERSKDTENSCSDSRQRKKVLGTGNQNHQIYQIFISQDAQDGTDPARLLAPLLEPNWWDLVRSGQVTCFSQWSFQHWEIEKLDWKV